ncbi:MAG TPA: HAMP domain-containing sensor histidine kinase [Blastocatellia bacterium]|nr:HAMP domain-containing sensor histidine kinase [Blastocatellia bacterium]HMV86946.1 HAMP domain-containing sensor histidine kinase [Blastocatellia bacterium]HMY72241.1 HAMP domain-containing sensor histidine kinase [Blastocatellia bacterium]HNG33713.1 HAMP domain-containing sensor histidine kinase [Blastocatellia bacterium]
MLRLREFLQQHALWVGLIAVAIPLLAHLWLQYKSLSQLESTLPYQRKAYMRKYLSQVMEKVILFYEEKAEEVLNVPHTAFNHTYPNPDYDPRTAINFEQVGEYFAKHKFNGARMLFVGIISGREEPSYVTISFFDPATNHFWTKASAEERSVAHAAAANWMAMIMTRSEPKSLRPTVDERDPKNRVIVKPIVNAEKRVVGVAGMFLDDQVFLTNYLSPAISEMTPKWFPDEYQQAIVTVLNREDKLVFANQQYDGKAFEVGWQFQFIYTDWFLGIRMRQMTEEEWSRRYFLTNLAFSALTALVLIGGIVLALRTASRAMKLSQMKADFVSNVSHELRTPLASIRVFGEFLKLGRVKDQPKIREYGDYIETESRRLTQLINNILDFSKIESGQKTYQFEQTNVEHVVADTLKTFEVVLEQNGFTVNLEKPAQPLPPVVIDQEAIAQAFINLLDNAVKYSGEAKEINVTLGQQNGFVTVAVRDYGVGIANEECEKVFEKFYRVGNVLVHDVKGSGLGLSIVKHIVEAHQGKVTVESQIGAGSTFVIHLPVNDGTMSKPAEPAGKHQAPTFGQELQISGQTNR